MSEKSEGKNPGESVIRAEEATVTAILQSKMTLQDCLREEDRQLVAYRIAEIMVAAKELYTRELPRMAADTGGDTDVDIFSELAGVRMSFLHIRDLITDFDEAFMVAMGHQRDDDKEEEPSPDQMNLEPTADDVSPN